MDRLPKYAQTQHKKCITLTPVFLPRDKPPPHPLPIGFKRRSRAGVIKPEASIVAVKVGAIVLLPCHRVIATARPGNGNLFARC